MVYQLCLSQKSINKCMSRHSSEEFLCVEVHPAKECAATPQFPAMGGHVQPTPKLQSPVSSQDSGCSSKSWLPQKPCLPVLWKLSISSRMAEPAPSATAETNQLREILLRIFPTLSHEQTQLSTSWWGIFYCGFVSYLLTEVMLQALNSVGYYFW